MKLKLIGTLTVGVVIGYYIGQRWTVEVNLEEKKVKSDV